MWDHELDPDGDVTLILHNPNAPFVVEVYEVSSPCGISSDGFGREVVPDVEPAPDAPGIEGPSADAVPEPDADLEPNAGPEPASRPKQEVRFRLSSRHLSLASSYFKAMLDGSWKESRDRVVNANDWDEEALVVLMCIIHGRTRFVPKLISLDQLVKIAVLVDYYKFHEAVEFVVEAWIGKLEQPKKMSRDLILWLLISWVFQRAEIFKSMTKIALHQSHSRLMLSNLPLPMKISRMIYRLRASIIEEILTSIQFLEHELIHGKAGCSSACSTMLLGALYRGMSVAHLPYHETSSLEGLSFDGVMKVVSEIQTPRWRPENSNYNYDSCTVVGLIKERIKIADVDGFSLEDIDIPFDEGRTDRKKRVNVEWSELTRRLIIRK